MNKYTLKVILESEAIFNSGEEEQNLVNNKVLVDEYGFVYFHAKTLKGQLRKKAKWLENKLASIKGKDKIIKYKESIVKLFGSEYRDSKTKNDSQQNEFNKALAYNNRGVMILSNLELKKEIRDYFKSININNELDNLEYKITPYDIMEAQTNRRARIQIGKDGVSEEHMMMTYHTVKDGLIFYSEINFLDEIDENDLTALNAIVSSLENLGSSINRGRGKIKAELLDEEGQRVKANDLGVFLNE